MTFSLRRTDNSPPCKNQDGSKLEPSDIEAHAQAFESEKQESQTREYQEGRVVIVIPDNGRDPELTKQYRKEQERRERES